jgi:undecaprenyl-phosphate 4-deoxy-4-formamido-L-arabinose transferase
MTEGGASLPSGTSVVVPVYNSEGTLRELVIGLKPVLDQTEKPFELILVNDGSYDRSWSVVEALSAQHAWVRGIDLMRNVGQENALLCGIRAAKFDTLALMDDDLQNPPEEIPRLLAELQTGFDVVYGTALKERHGMWRGLGSLVTKLILQRAMGAKNARNVTAFKVMRTQLRESFAHYRGPFVSIDVLLTWGTQRFGAIKVRQEPRKIGRSNFTFWMLVNHAINMATGFSVLPLQLASLMGLVFAVLGLAVLVYVISEFIWRGDPVPGFPFLAAIVSIFSGVQMFALGIMGEYLARIHLRSMGRRPYTVRRKLGDERVTLRHPDSLAVGTVPVGRSGE